MTENQVRSFIVKALTSSFESINYTIAEILNILEFFSKLQNYVEEIRIYLDEDIYNLINSLIEEYRKYFSEISALGDKLSKSKEEDRKGEVFKFKKMLEDRISVNDLKTAKQSLIKEFRSLLGVN